MCDDDAEGQIGDLRASLSAAECEVDRLRSEVAFWRDQQRFAASAAATIADLDEVAPALRQMLRREAERRRRAEGECARLAYEVACLKGEQA